MRESFVVGFLHSYDLERWLLIDKGFTMSRSGNYLKWCGLGGKIQPQVGGNWSIIEDHPELMIAKHDYAPLDHWERLGIPFEYMLPRDFESPHMAMEREFLEESGYKVTAKRWNCFHIKTYQQSKVFCFNCAASPDELEKVKLTRTLLPEGDLDIHHYVDMCFSPDKYTFDLRYLIPMIILESQKGMLQQLDPEGVNSEFKRSIGT